jgi:hypothetical protein
VSQKPHINDILRVPAADRVPRIELQQTEDDDWVVTLVNHRRQERSDGESQELHEAFAWARELAAFLDWPVVRIWKKT